jgi:protein-disulfide isomerase
MPFLFQATAGSSRFQRTALHAVRLLVLLASAGAVQAADPSQEALEKALKNLLKTQPQLVRDALNDLQRRDALDKARQDRQALAQSAKALNAEVGATVLGNPDGDVTLVEFIDYRCGYCKSLSASIDTLIQRDGRLRVVVKHYPILGPESAQAAQLVLAAPRGDSAQQVHRALLASASLDAPALQAIGVQFGVTAAPADGSSKALAEVSALADRLGIQGTPAIVIGGTLIRGAADVAQLEAAIQLARQQKAAPRGAKAPAVASL